MICLHQRESPELDSHNTMRACDLDEKMVNSKFLRCALVWKCPQVAELISLYNLGYLVKVGFLEKPKLNIEKLPCLPEWENITVLTRTGK